MSESQSTNSHRAAAAEEGPITIGVVTVSDTRTEEDDRNGKMLQERIESAGHRLGAYRLIRDDPERVEEVLDELAGAVRILVFNGGTGIAARDNTFDAVSSRLEKTLPGFGELFRMLSWEQVGSAAMMSRAVAGVYRDTVVFSTPGSPAAVELAWDQLIEPEIEHLAWELGR